MKKLYFILFFLISSFLSYGQKYFVGGHGNNEWSNASNWSNGKPNALNAVVVIKAATVVVDQNVTIGWLKKAKINGTKYNTVITASNNSTLTLSGKGTGGNTISIVNLEVGKDLKLDLPVKILKEGNQEYEDIKVNEPGSASITFGSNSTLTLENHIRIIASLGTRRVNFNGTLLGAKSIKFGSAGTNTSTRNTIEFGAGFNAANWTGNLVFSQNYCAAISNVTGNNTTLLPQNSKIETLDNVTGSLLKLEGENAGINGILKSAGGNTGGPLNVTINANQSTMGILNVGAQNINLNIATAVTEVSFADHSGVANWGIGKLNIQSGFAANEIKFGNNASGLTAANLAKVAVHVAGAISLNASGYLKVAGSSEFTNAGGNNLWSNAANWSDGVPTSTVAATIKATSVILDVNAEVKQLKFANNIGDATISNPANNNSTLTINGTGVTQPIQNNSGNDDIDFNVKVILPSNDAESYSNTVAGAAKTASMTFSKELALTGSGVTKFVAQDNKSVHLNGILSGSGPLHFAGISKVNFGSEFNASNYTGDITLIGNNSTVISNTKDNNTFLPAGRLLQTEAGAGKGDGHTITVNGANTLKGNIKTTAGDVSLNINKSQSSVGTVTIGDGDLNLTINANATEVNFADHANVNWGAGKLVVSGFVDNVMKFGTNAQGLTAAQLAKIDVGGRNPEIAANGKLTIPVATANLTVNTTDIKESGATSATVTVTLSKALATNETITLAATGTATGSGTDYTLSTTSIAIAAGQTTGTATVTAVDDVIDDNNETVIIDIASVSANVVENGTQQVTITIEDNDVGASDFDNGGANNRAGSGNNLWSNAANWSNGKPNITTAKVTLKASPIVDSDVEVSQIKVATTAGDITVSSANNSTLTLNGTGVTQPVQHNAAGKDLKFKALKVVISSSDEEIVKATGIGLSTITFDTDSELTLSAQTEFVAEGNREIRMNGVLKGDKAFIVGNGTDVFFGNAANNSTFTGGFKYKGTNSKITSNITPSANNPSLFLKAGASVQPGVAANASLILNGANTYGGNIMIQNNKEFVVKVNADQADAGLVDLDSGNLKLVMDANVTALAFDNASQVSWGAGTMQITNFVDKIISFGTDSTGLTVAQLAKINIGNTDAVIDSNGKIAGKVTAQSTFTNAGGDHLWSNKANWSNGIPNTTLAQIVLTDSLILDINAEIAQLKVSGVNTPNVVTVTSNNNSTLTFNGKSVGAIIQNNRSDLDLYFDIKVVSSPDTIKSIQVNGGGTSSITFGRTSDLTLNKATRFLAQGANRNIKLHGILRGAGAFQVGAMSSAIFEPASDNANFTGVLDLYGQGATITAKTTGSVNSPKSFLDAGKKLLVTGIAARLNLDADNILNGNIENGPYGAVKVFVNKKQETVGTIKVGQSDSEIVLDTALYATTNTLVSFADHSNVTWGLGKLIVKGFKDKSLRFGTNANGLPQNLLDKVFVGGGKVVIDSLGYLHRDQDGDGVRDTEDQCPNTPPGEQVDANGPNAGCSDSQKDSDGDGVSDDKDKCPGTPAGEIVDADGCPIPLFVEKLTFVENIYPNPAKDHLKVILKDNSKVKDIHFVGLSGKISKPRNFNQYNRTLNINISNLNDGIYLMNVNTEKGSNRVKIVIKK